MCILLTSSQEGIGEESSSNDGPKKNYAELISQLASPNKEPMTHDGASVSVKFPAGYDVKGQKRIEAVRQLLEDNIDDSLPYLFAALDDQRYCMTISWGEGEAYVNESVGSICRDVIASQLEVYRDKIRFSGPKHWYDYDYPISKKWYKTRTGRSIAELQIEAIDWATEHRKKEPKDKVREDRNSKVSELQKLRGAILKSGKPAKPMGMLRMITHDAK